MKSILVLTILAISCTKCLSENFELLLLHNNDMHSRFEETSATSTTCDPETEKCYGGFARTAHVIREARKKAKDGTGPPVLYLNGGDTYAGTLWFNAHKDVIVAAFLNLLKPDAISFGNHEFDLKVEGLIPFINAAEFPIVAANLDFSKEPDLQKTHVKKSVIIEIKNRKIGVIGYLTLETARVSSPGNVIFEDEVAAIKRESEALDKQGVKIIIAVGHSGFEVDKKIAKEVPLVDLVVGGHTNTFLWNGDQPDLEKAVGPYPYIVEHNNKKVPVVQAYAYTKYMGSLELVFDDSGNLVEYKGQPLLLDHEVPQEEDVLDLLETYRDGVTELEKEVLGYSHVKLDGKPSCRTTECNLGNFIADAYVAYVSEMISSSKYWTEYPIAIINGGGIRTTIERKEDGKLTRGDLLNVLPYQDPIYTMNIKGSDLRETLEIGARSKGETKGGEFIQTSGIHYKVNTAKEPLSRIEDIKVRCGDCDVPKYEDLEDDKVYRIITTGYLSNGGDEHKPLQDKAFNKTSTDITDIEMVAWYLKKLSQVNPEEDERIISYSNSGVDRLKGASVFVLIWTVFSLVASQ